MSKCDSKVRRHLLIISYHHITCIKYSNLSCTTYKNPQHTLRSLMFHSNLMTLTNTNTTTSISPPGLMTQLLRLMPRLHRRSRDLIPSHIQLPRPHRVFPGYIPVHPVTHKRRRCTQPSRR
ncbi:hypothetical protein Hanom_Chr17g01555961 [Helianthus anomalus]